MEGGSEMIRKTVKEALKASAGHSAEVLLQETGLFSVCVWGGRGEDWRMGPERKADREKDHGFSAQVGTGLKDTTLSTSSNNYLGNISVIDFLLG